MGKKKKKKKVKLSPSREAMLSRYERSELERWLDRHNHKMEFLRTLFALLTITLQVVILGKIFNII